MINCNFPVCFLPGTMTNKLKGNVEFACVIHMFNLHFYMTVCNLLAIALILSLHDY